MQETTGRDSSTSQQSSWPADSHSGKHFTLVTFPDGRIILTCPDNIDQKEFEAIQALFTDWVHAANAYPLVIGNCQVVMAPVAPRSVTVQRV